MNSSSLFRTVLAWVVMGLVTALWLPSAFAQTTTINCTGGTGTVTFNPAMTTAIQDVTATIDVNYPHCSGAGVTSVAMHAQITSLSSCIDGTGLALVAINTGLFTATWQGGTGAPTTTFLQTSPLGVQETTGQTVTLGAAISTAGRYNGLLPAAMVLTASDVEAQQICPGISSVAINGGSMAVIVPL
jgi:hypothetical protein